MMHWAWKKKTRKTKEEEEVGDTAMAHEPLLEGSRGEEDKKAIAKGQVPVLVGQSEERVVVPVKLLKKPCVKELLDIAAMEFGYGQKGVLRIPCEVEQFRKAISAASKGG